MLKLKKLFPYWWAFRWFLYEYVCFHFTNNSAMNISQQISLHPGAYISEGSVPRSGIIWSTCTCTLNSGPTPRFLSANAANHTKSPISWWDCPVSSFLASIGVFSMFSMFAHLLAKERLLIIVQTCTSLTIMKLIIFLFIYCFDNKSSPSSPSLVAQLFRASYWYTKVVGLISSEGTYKTQPINA